MAAQSGEAYNSDIGILRELYHLNRYLDDAQASRRALLVEEAARSDRRSRSSRHLFMSLSPCLHNRSQQEPEGDDDNGGDGGGGGHHAPVQNRHQLEHEPGGRRRGLWSWKPMRALAHIGKHRVTCLFSVEVVMIRHLAPWANGLRLSVAVRKKETTEAAAQTMPSRVMQGSAEFEETLLVRCHLYCRGGGAGAWKPLRFEPRPFLITAVAVDAPNLDLGKNMVDLSLLVQESINQKNLEGKRIRQWDLALQLSGKAESGELVLKIAALKITDGGIGICNYIEELKPEEMADYISFIPRKLPKSSFSITSPRVMADEPSSTHSKWTNRHYRDTEGSEKLGLYLPVLNPCVSTATLNLQFEDFDLPEYEVVDKGIEIQDEREDGVMSQNKAQGGSISREDVNELELISQNVTAPVLMMTEGADFDLLPKSTQEHGGQNLDTEEETVTREFLQMLELDESQESEHGAMDLVISLNLGEELDDSDEEEHVLLPDLGKSLGPVILTRHGGYLASMNPFNARVAKKEPPKVAMQISRELILDDMEGGRELFRRLAALGPEELSAKLFSLTSMDELVGKTAEQIAFEGIASAITSGRNKEGASSNAAKSIAALKKMAAAMRKGRKDRILTGIWSEDEELFSADEMVTSSSQKMEAMAVEALKVQAEITEEDDEVPFVAEKDDSSNNNNPLDKAISFEDWSKICSKNSKIAMLVVIQMRDPSRRYEAVGGPMIAVVEGGGLDENQVKEEEEQEEGKRRFKLMSVHVGGLKLRSKTNNSAWDGKAQRLSARQWLMESGMGEPSRFRRRRKGMEGREGYNLMWTFSSRLTAAGVWLNPVRNPNMKL